MAGDKFMSELHLRQLGINYSACGLLWTQKLKETGDLNYNYKNALYKTCFVHDAAYANSKDLFKRTISDKILKERSHEIAINLRYKEDQRGLAIMMYKFVDKK